MNQYCKMMSMLALVLTSNVFSHEQSATELQLKPYQTANSTLHEINSSLVEQTYELIVELPPNYNENSSKVYPVIYVMDGQWHFSIIKSIVGKLIADNLMPETIIVGVTWAGKDPNYSVLRHRDFIPLVMPNIASSGGADKFIEVLEKELVPYIEDHFRNNNERVLIGSSHGGLITSYVLMKKPRLFNKYVISAGSLWVMPDDLSPATLQN